MPSFESHNHAMLEAMEKIKEEEKSYVIHHMGKAKGERAFILIEKGTFKGIGFSPYEVQISNLEHLSDFLEPLPVTEINQSIALSYIENPRGWQVEAI
ncbi:MAG: hypothetical protein ACOYLH_12105 [Flavobacteriales bacterium]